MPSRRRIKITLQLMERKTCMEGFSLTAVLLRTIALNQCATSAAKYSSTGNRFHSRTQRNCHLWAEHAGVSHEDRKHHQEATAVLTGLLRAIGAVGCPSVPRSREGPGPAVREAPPLAVPFSRKEYQGLPHLVLSFRPCLLEEGQ